MKKFMFLSIVVLSIVLLCTIVCANAVYIKAIKVKIPITVNNVEVKEAFSMVSIDNRIYMPLRALCDTLNIRIDWIEEGRVEISTFESNDNIKDFQISKAEALKFAEIIFEERFGHNFVQNTNVSLEELDDMYKVYRCLVSDPPILGGDGIIYIDKKDGHIIDIIAGE